MFRRRILCVGFLRHFAGIPCRYKFPSRLEACQSIISLIQRHSDMDIVLGIDSLGKGEPVIKSFTGGLRHEIAIHAFSSLTSPSACKPKIPSAALNIVSNATYNTSLKLCHALWLQHIAFFVDIMLASAFPSCSKTEVRLRLGCNMIKAPPGKMGSTIDQWCL